MQNEHQLLRAPGRVCRYNCTGVDEERKMANSFRDKSEGTYRSGEGGSSACYVKADLSYYWERAREQREGNIFGIKKKEKRKS